VGIVNRTPDSFFDRGKFFNLDDALTRAEQLIFDGADVIDVGGVKAGPGEDVSVNEEIDRVVPVICALKKRFDVALSVDTWRSEVAREAYAAGALIGNDISGFSDPEYLKAASQAGATVVATHIRLAPRVPDPDPHYSEDDVVGAVCDFLRARRDEALAAGIAAQCIILDAGLDLGKTAEQSLALLRASGRIASIGQPLLLSASNKTFLGTLCGLSIDERREISLAAVALGVSLGCRVVRVHDVKGTRRVIDVLEAIISS
jgi:dihydropteroate synthase